MATGMLNRVSIMVPLEVKFKAYYALNYSRLICGILSWVKSSYGNKATLERIFKRAWRVIYMGIWTYVRAFLILSLCLVILLGESSIRL